VRLRVINHQKVVKVYYFYMKNIIIISVVVVLGFIGWNFYTNNVNTNSEINTDQVVTDEAETTIDVLMKYFVDGALAEEITIEDCVLSDGSTTECYHIAVAGYPANTEPGPFCPTTIDTPAEEAGIWLDGENLYDADGEFITELAEIYDDQNWKLYNDDGTVNVTDTAEAFAAAARPDVDEAYQNYCVEGRLEYLTDGEPIVTTILVPVNPVQTDDTMSTSKTGVALNGVVIDPAAPVAAILGAYTIAAFDDCGGHFNPVEGYHYHAAIGCAETGVAEFGETKRFGVAMDGFMIHSPYEEGQEPTDLDECNGHTTDALGYHYHANSPEENAVLSCITGLVEETNVTTGGQGGVRPDGPPPGRE
jgi:hypothetical protein